MTKILIIANDESTIYNFRREIIKAFIEEKFSVVVCYPLGIHTQEIKQIGCELENIEVNRHGKNVLQDFKLFLTCKSLIKRHKPDIVLTYTIKPNIYGSFACQLTNKPYINNITGLGSILQTKGLLSGFMLFLQKYAYKKSSCLFFQNRYNYAKLKEYGVISEKTLVKFLPGSGVNLELQSYETFPPDDSVTKFIIVSRIRVDKGYREFFEAAERIKKRYPKTEFHVVGWYEEEELKTRVYELDKRNIIRYHGQKTQEEVHDLIKQCNCLVHPSYHEGMANVLLEAAATGRPVIASTIPGCIETFEENITGFGCQAKNAGSLFEAMEKLILTPYERQVEMGRMARKKMENQFDRKIVAELYIQQIRQKLENVHKDR